MNNSPFERHIFGALDTVPSDRKILLTVRLNTKVTVPECVCFLYGLISNSWFSYQGRNVW